MTDDTDCGFELPTVEQLRAMKRCLWLNDLVNRAASLFGLMVFFSGWCPTGIVKRPKIRLYGDTPRIIYEDSD